MRILLNFLPLLFLAAAAYSSYKFCTAETDLLKWVPLSIAAAGAFVTSLSWRIAPPGTGRMLTGICFVTCLLLGVWFCLSPGSVRETWIPSSVTAILSIHLSLFALAGNSFLFSGGRKIVLVLPLLFSLVGIAGLFLWNGTLALCGIGMIAAVIFALLATIFGIEKKKTAVHPGDN